MAVDGKSDFAGIENCLLHGYPDFRAQSSHPALTYLDCQNNLDLGPYNGTEYAYKVAF